ncbi:DUF4468 domain-containing protein [Flavobacterium sp. SUN046]|uniref:DUF4468 domain-containing protein n=1 Tax=Flavobacterium sp. SUN046 TaxID=3002440 RepID=UPI002DB5C268|nr:DUF4468 domain-containing protein [Flavobacterium sp. SUN046]MEC4049781.1 DUF4468 domain-containing protein [Flavobacterium sp. SUN046]
MKKAIILLAFSVSINALSQSKVEITKDGIINTDQVIKLDSISAKEIYTNINKYIQKNYSNPSYVAKGSIENEFISINGIKKNCVTEKVLLSNFYSDLEYYFNIDIKDSKIRITTSKLILNKKIDGSNYPTDLLNIKGSDYFKEDGSLRKQPLKKKEEIENAINTILIDIVSSIKDKKTKSDW